jgi:hypothetical protein
LHSVEDKKAAAFDPNRVERESERVDVCIVGGGKYDLALI